MTLGRVFLRKGLVKHIANRVCVTRMLVLLSDCLLYCKVKAGSKLVVQNMLPVRDIEVRTYRHTEIQTYIDIDIETDIQTDRQTDRQTYRQTYRHTDIQTCRQTDP